MNNRKAVIFDMGGVLVDLDMQGCRDAFKRILNYHRIDELLDPCHQKGIIGELEEGLLSSDEFRQAVLWSLLQDRLRRMLTRHFGIFSIALPLIRQSFL